jgi:hypothetical protein
LLVTEIAALVDVVGMDAGVELEELEVGLNGLSGGLGREGLGADGDGRVGSTEGSEVGVVLSTDDRTLATLVGNVTLGVVSAGT